MKKVFSLLTVAVIVFVPMILLAQGPMPEIDPGEASKNLFDGIGAKNWTLIIAGGGLVVMYLLRLFLLPNLKGKALAITSTVLIGLAGVATSMVAGGDILSAVGVGFTAALVAGKAWDLIPDKVTDAAEKPIKKKQG